MASQRIRRRCKPVALPIVDAQCRIVGWTDTVPKVVGHQMWHPEAERLVGLIDTCIIEVDDPNLAFRAGAPSGWKGAWRCIAICSAELTTRVTPERLIIQVLTVSPAR